VARYSLPPEIDLVRLRDAVRADRLSLETFRREREDAVKQYVGYHYSRGGTTAQVPVNLIGLYVSVMSRALVAKEPRVMLSTFDAKARPAVDQMQQWLNEEAERTNLGDTLRRWVIDALFSVGILKVALASPDDLSMTDAEVSVGEPLASVVDLDDWVCDLYARDPSEFSYCGHRYRVPLDVAKKLYRRGRGEELHPSSRGDTNAEGDFRVNVIGRGTRGSSQEFEEYVDLWEIYLPRHRLVVTLLDDGGLPADGVRVKPLRVQKWIGPYCGPYHLLGFGVVPGNVMPKSPVMDLMDLHLAVNRTYRKLVDEVDRYKSVLPVRGAAMDDAGRIKQANDGDIIQCDNASEAKEVAYGGPAQILQLFVQDLMQKAEYIGGNMALLGGRAPQSRTAAQDKMLNENAGAGVADMQGTVVSGVASVMKAFCWYGWHHPTKTYDTSRGIPGTDYSISRKLHPFDPTSENFLNLSAQGATMRQGPLPNLKVDPYSLAHTTPQQRSQFLTSVVAEMTPLMQLLQSQGVQFDINAYLDLKAKYGDEPDVQKVFKYAEPMGEDATNAPSGSDSGIGPRSPAMNGGTYTRVSVGQNSPAAKANDLRTQLMAAGQNGKGNEQ
jgi:hypothetical protein